MYSKRKEKKKFIFRLWLTVAMFMATIDFDKILH